MKEFRHFVGVSVEVILVEYEDSLERIKDVNRLECATQAYLVVRLGQDRQVVRS